MSEAALLARLHDRPGALERAVGLIRRRAHRITRISLASAPARDVRSADAASDSAPHGLAPPRTIELLLRVDESRTPRERVVRDLLSLEDLIEVRELGVVEAEATRELLLAWIRPHAVPRATGNGRVVATANGDLLLEVTGEPAEIDALLARLVEIDALTASVRSGEIAAPLSAPPPIGGTS